MAKDTHKWCKSCGDYMCERNYYPAVCEDCGWQGCSVNLELTQCVAGDADVYCPDCDSPNVEEDYEE
jgi:hypothetical protein